MSSTFIVEQQFKLSDTTKPYRVSLVVEYPNDAPENDEGGLQEEIRQDIQKQILHRLLDNVSVNAGIRIDDEFSE